ncbi:hypothetical protein [Pelagicoccus sp. SDUM812003]|uniref:hypothetical protein n=1 Tax=Pelagicoccus sp. SDUM812003 TaxID=3041267 RepID=UPI00280F84C7|nr:hypothetical protein [Pelagicoccus sp. SDUM812003]MDQ8203925.1 hypothetical protein [Pelagicoccus sp. SDUM812003]
MSAYSLLALVSLAYFLQDAPRVMAQEEGRPIWEEEAMLIYSDSSAEFTRLRTFGRSNKRLGAYTEALDVLHGKIELEGGEEPYRYAQSLFRSLVAENDSDAIGLASLYYLARIAQSNPIEQDMTVAKQLYYDLYLPNKDRFFGQMAFIKYATMEIYDEQGEEPDVARRLSELERMAASLSLPEIRRNFHRIAGEAYVHFDLDARAAFEHLETAYEMGLPVESIRIEVLELLAELGEQVGEPRRALQAYNELLLIDPRHERAEHFRSRARELRRTLAVAGGK